MKLLLVDDHGLFREGLSLLIQQQMMLQDKRLPLCHVLEAGSMREAVDTAHRHPDLGLVFLDLGLPDGQGLDTLAQWRQWLPQVPVVILSADDRHDTVMAAIEAGASGFISKTARSADMCDAVQTVLSGGVYLPAVTRAAHDAGMVGLGAGDDRTESDLGLSARQLDVLRLLVDGRPNKDICRVLNLTESTVKTHLAAIFRKLGVNNRTQAVVAVARRGVRLPMSPGDDLTGGA